MKISVITVSFNSAATIGETLASVAEQSFREVEHIVVDGASTDGTAAIVRKQGANVARLVSEPDQGIYDAMNKGLALASGDVVGFLNADDRYAGASVLGDVAKAFGETQCDFVYGDIDMVDPHGRIARAWVTGTVSESGLTSTQIPHPAFFVRTSVLRRLSPPFDPSYRICADIKQQLAVVNKLGARGTYLPYPLAVMRLGGASTSGLSNYLLSWREARRAYNEVMGSGGAWYTFRKVLWKLRGVRPFGRALTPSREGAGR